ncbi:DUF417 family protein [Pedobacter sp. N36a]|uniref:DUF417 family protein n=1 Tax=Pedobacter sp. N36a TaxID=2767996 RepID=UPI0016569CE1|nr:DUF417 family protein [Pedobacter sp. N36a]MBC8987848.1 DUF417 family protein [Pedobacter sp. N36a]
MSAQFTAFLQTLLGLTSLSIRLIRIAIAIVLIWIGGLKVYNYEAEGIVPLVENSALMSFFYADPTGYKPYMQKEGEANPEKIAWDTDQKSEPGERSDSIDINWSCMTIYGVYIV